MSATPYLPLIKTDIQISAVMYLTKYALYKQKSNYRNLLYSFCHVWPSEKGFILVGFPDMIMQIFFHILSRILITRGSVHLYIYILETSEDAVISNMRSGLDLLPSLWNFINFYIDWEKNLFAKIHTTQ